MTGITGYRGQLLKSRTLTGRSSMGRRIMLGFKSLLRHPSRDVKKAMRQMSLDRFGIAVCKSQRYRFISEARGISKIVLHKIITEPEGSTTFNG